MFKISFVVSTHTHTQASQPNRKFHRQQQNFYLVSLNKYFKLLHYFLVMKGCSPESSGLGFGGGEGGGVAKNLFSSTTHGGWQKVWEVININISTFQTHALFRPNPAPRRMFGKSSKIHAFLLDAGEKKQQQLCV